MSNCNHCDGVEVITRNRIDIKIDPYYQYLSTTWTCMWCMKENIISSYKKANKDNISIETYLELERFNHQYKIPSNMVNQIIHSFCECLTLIVLGQT